MKLNEKIAYYRRKQKLSQEELAARVGVSRQAVSKWELGESAPEAGKLLALARELGITADHLLSEEDPLETPPPRESAPPPPARETPPPADLPGLLGKLVRRWGWLAGIYLALQGLGLALVGGIARWGFGSMFAASHSMIQEIAGPGGWSYSGPPELESAVMDALGLTPQVSPFSGVERFFLGFAGLLLFAGLAVAAGGVVLALYLHARRGEGGPRP